MVDYSKVQVVGVQSENSDYSTPYVEFKMDPLEATPLYSLHQIIPVPTTALHRVDMTMFTKDAMLSGCDWFAIHNRSATNTVEVVWLTPKGQYTSGADEVTFTAAAPGVLATVVDATSSPFTTLLRMQRGNYIHISGSTDNDTAAGSELFVDDINSTDEITLGDGEALVAAAPEAAEVTITSLGANYQKLPPEGYILIPGPIYVHWGVTLLTYDPTGNLTPDLIEFWASGS